jgi:FkbM family methyltransferase
MPVGLRTRLVVGAANVLPAALARRLRHDSRGGRWLRPFANRLLPRQEIVAVVRSGPARGVVLPLHPWEEKFYWTGAYERPLQDALVSVLEPGMVFWDVGAHVGFFSALGSRLVGASGSVHAFEPVDENRRRLEKTLELNGISNVVVHRTAVAGEDGEAELHAHASSSMWSLVSGQGHVADRVACSSLDTLARQLGAPQVVKIDVEGVEAHVIRGGLELLRSARPTILFECADECADELLAGLVPFYERRQLTKFHWLLR